MVTSMFTIFADRCELNLDIYYRSFNNYVYYGRTQTGIEF